MQTSLALIALVMGLPLSASVALAKASIHLPEPGVPGTPGQQLQDAVNDSANAGVRIWLASGSYSLDPAKPNGGRLFLQPGMDIIGENEYSDCDGDGVWDPVGACSGDPFDPEQYTAGGSETLIDGTAIVSALSGAAVVRAGSNNLIEGVTIRAPRRATVGGGLDVNLAPPPEGISAVVRDNILEGGQRGIRCNNGSPARSGISSQATIERNVIRDNLPLSGGLFGFGFQLQNSGGTDNSWTVHLRNNRILGNRFGLFIVSTNSRTSDSKVLSQANIIHDNQAGGFIIAGFSPTGAPAGDSTTGHRMWFNSQWDSFLYNITPSGDSDPLFLSLGGGLVAFAAGRDSATAGLNSDNQLSLQLLHSTFLGNVGVPGPLHLTLIGSFSSPISTPKTGSDNELSVLMRHTISDGEPDSFVLADSFPEDPLGTNAITLIGSAVAFERTNLGWEVPPEEFFLSREK